MAHIDALIEKVSDPALRDSLREQVDTLLRKRSFGLVFQEHKPETVELPNYRIKQGSKVRIRSAVDGSLWKVTKVSSGVAHIASISENPQELEVELQDLVIVREFGEAIYPGLRSLGSVENGGEKPFNAVINAENYHALETLMFTHENLVDAIYIDPPYNSGARDWKYNNDYVDGIDQYRHSKWLAFIERRLVLARRLLNPQRSVLVVTIDEKEVHHLGMLLEQMFPSAVRQMVTVVNSPLGQPRKQELARVEEYAFFIFIGDAYPVPGKDDLLSTTPQSSRSSKVRWEWLLRGGTNAKREDRPNGFYPIFVDPKKKSLAQIGSPLALGESRESVAAPPGTVAVWPLRTDGSEGRWRVSADSLREMAALGYAKAGAYDAKNDRWSILYLGRSQVKRIQTGDISIAGRDPNGAVIVEHKADQASGNSVIAKTVWNRLSHRAGEHGSSLVKKFVPGRSFPFPKSLYAVQDTLRVMVGDNPDALVIDFFAGSGTTGHALARLNAEDGGKRRFILVTNNEVSEQEAKALRQDGWRPGDRQWEDLGIFHYITRPRIEAAITGITHDGDIVEGEYLDERPFAEGFPENVEFFELTYEDPDIISLGRKFNVIAPLLWLKAGAIGGRVDHIDGDWSIPANSRYAVLFDVQKWRPFVEAVKRRPELTHVFVITDSEAVFQQIVSELPSKIAPGQLYDGYLRTFAINTGGRP